MPRFWEIAIVDLPVQAIPAWCAQYRSSTGDVSTVRGGTGVGIDVENGPSQPPESLLHETVVIAALAVSRYFQRSRGAGGRRVVGQCDDDDGSSVRHQSAGIPSGFDVAGHVVHPRGVAGLQPANEALVFVGGPRGGDADGVEAKL